MTLKEKNILLCEMRTELMRYAALAVVSEKPLDKIMYMYMSMGKRFDIQRIWATPIPKLEMTQHFLYGDVDTRLDLFVKGRSIVARATTVFPKQVILRP